MSSLSNYIALSCSLPGKKRCLLIAWKATEILRSEICYFNIESDMLWKKCSLTWAGKFWRWKMSRKKKLIILIGRKFGRLGQIEIIGPPPPKKSKKKKNLTGNKFLYFINIFFAHMLSTNTFFYLCIIMLKLICLLD